MRRAVPGILSYRCLVPHAVPGRHRDAHTSAPAFSGLCHPDEHQSWRV